METLSKTTLNRTLLARQMLRQREKIPIMDAINHLIGLQSQIPNPPYIGLWTRLDDFEHNSLTQLLESRAVVRAALMRSTLHLVTAEMHNAIRLVLSPALERALNAFFGKRAKSLDIPLLVENAKPFIEAEQPTTGDLKQFLLSIAPDEDADAMAYAVRNNLPLVQVYPAGTWGSGTRAQYTTADSVIGADDSEADDLKTLLERYLRAFGPASIMDFQAWSGMTRLKAPIQKMADHFTHYQDENGKVLLDVPGLPILPADTPVPVRFIPEYDNLLVAHAERTRIIADEDRQYVFLSAARVLPTILVDGFVQGVWKIERDKEAATLRIAPFTPLDDAIQSALMEEGDALLRFVEPDVATVAVTFVDAL